MSCVIAEYKRVQNQKQVVRVEFTGTPINLTDIML